jgi:SAM-dependent methyltransferase
MLDIGCGKKPYRNLFVVDKYVGIDIENEGHHNDTSHVDVFYDCIHIPFEDGHFDSAYTTEVLTHISDIEPVAAEINRVMKKGCTLLVTVLYIWHENEQPIDAVRYTCFGIIKLLQRHGFDILVEKMRQLPDYRIANPKCVFVSRFIPVVQCSETDTDPNIHRPIQYTLHTTIAYHGQKPRPV